jgi:Ca2+-binding EF-hand superfamily protein
LAGKLSEVFQRMDTNHDGKVSFEEFKIGIASGD